MTTSAEFIPELKERGSEGQEALAMHEEIYVLHWGATMILADFFVLVHLNNSNKTLAVRLSSIEYGEFGRQRAIPTKDTLISEIYEARIDGDEVRIKFGFDKKWRNLKKWDGRAVVINTLD